jgi:hypothetical protein
LLRCLSGEHMHVLISEHPGGGAARRGASPEGRV